MIHLNLDSINLDNVIWSFDLDSALKHILKFLSTHINISRSVIYIYNEKNNTLNSELVFINGMILMGDEEIFVDKDNPDQKIWAVLNNRDIIAPSYMYLPLHMEGKTYGLISIDKSIDNATFTADEISFIKKIAKYIGTGIYQEKIIRDRDDRIKQLNALLQISILLNSKESTSILQYVGKALIKYGKFDRVRIFLKKEDDCYYCVVSESIIQASEQQSQKLYSSQSFQTYNISDIYHFIALETGQAPLGYVEVDNIISQAKFEEEQINFLKIIAAQLSITLNNISLIEQLQLISNTDPMTGVFNYRYLIGQFKKEINRARRTNQKFSVLLIDIDDFKKINDSYGHLTGDEALRSLAQVMKNNTRNIDVISRYGGDEFIILAPNTELRNAIQLAQKILQKCPQIKFKNKKEKIKLSIGISIFPDDSQNMEKLIKLADQNLYQAKKSGKNQIFTKRAGKRPLKKN